MTQDELKAELIVLLPDLKKLISIMTQEDDSVVDDILQTTFVECLQRLETYDPTRASLKTWASVIARSTALDVVRQRRTANNYVSLVDAKPDGEDGELQELDVAEEVEVVDEEAERQQEQLIALLHKHLTKLPETQRSVLELYYVQNKTEKEIAAMRHTTQQSVAQCKKRALNRLRNLLRNYA